MIVDLTVPAGSVFTADDLVREVKHLPSAPKVLPRLKELLTDGDSAMHEIVALIRLDPGIAARVLQVANSAYFSKGVRCLSVEEAVIRVGFDQVYELVSYAVASQVLVRPLEVYGIEADELWKHSVVCAIAAEVIAARTGQDASIAYTVGLLHRVGMVAIDEWALRHARGLVLTGGGFPREAMESERARFGFTQADVGGALLQSWEFSPLIAEPVRGQYAPGASALHAPMACLLYAARWVGTTVCAGAAGRPLPPTAVQLQPLALTPANLQGLVRDVALRLAEVSSLVETSKVGAQTRHRFPGRRSASGL